MAPSSTRRRLCAAALGSVGALLAGSLADRVAEQASDTPCAGFSVDGAGKPSSTDASGNRHNSGLLDLSWTEAALRAREGPTVGSERRLDWATLVRQRPEAYTDTESPGTVSRLQL